MSSGLTKTDQMCYAGEAPWHGQGNTIESGATPEDVIKAANLGWTLETKPLFYDGPAQPDAVAQSLTNPRVAVPRKAMIRSDTGDLMDVVGPKYEPAQPAEVVEFFRDYLKVGQLEMNTAGSLWGGRYVWCLAKLGSGFTLAGGDEVRGHLLVANPNRYGKGMIVKFVMEQVVCWNTLTAALRETGRAVTIAHNRKFDAEARADAAEKIGLAHTAIDRLRQESEALAARQITEAEIAQVLTTTFKVPNADDGTVKASRKVERVRALFNGAGLGASLASQQGTAWGLLSAVTQFVDHEYGRQGDKRLLNSWFGGGEAMKNRARRAVRQLITRGG